MSLPSSFDLSCCSAHKTSSSVPSKSLLIEHFLKDLVMMVGLTPSILLISQDHPNHRFEENVTDQYDLLDYIVLKSNSSSIINICKINYLA